MTSPRNTILQGDCLQILPQLAAGSVQFILTDPPYITRSAGCFRDYMASRQPWPGRPRLSPIGTHNVRCPYHLVIIRSLS
jgi:hypothetical protein